MSPAVGNNDDDDDLKSVPLQYMLAQKIGGVEQDKVQQFVPIFVVLRNDLWHFSVVAKYHF